MGGDVDLRIGTPSGRSGSPRAYDVVNGREDAAALTRRCPAILTAERRHEAAQKKAGR